MKQLFFALLALTVLSCKDTNQTQIVQGDIYIKLLDVISVLSQLSEEEIKTLDKIDNSNQKEYTNSEKKAAAYFKILIENNLEKKPHFKLITKNGKIINVFTNNSEQIKLAKYLNKLDRDKEKVTVKFEGIKISNGIFDPDGTFDQAIYMAKQIVLIQKTKGITEWAK